MKRILIFLALCSYTSLVQAQYFKWGAGMGGSGLDGTYSIATDKDGNVYSTGYFTNTADFDPGSGTYNLTTAGAYDMYLTKLSSFGVHLWTKQIAGTEDNGGYCVTTDAAGNVYTSGWFKGTVDFDPGPATYNMTSAGVNDIFVLKMDKDGNLLWARQMGGSDDDMGYGIKVDAAGNVYTCGLFMATADFDPSPAVLNMTSGGSYDIFISKLDAAGGLVWARQMSGPNIEWANALSLDAAGNILLTGIFRSTVDFDPGPGLANMSAIGTQNDCFIAKLDNGGNLVWAKRIGDVSNESGNSIATDATGNVYVTGSYSGAVDFDPGAGTTKLTSPAGYDDIFICKFDAAGSLKWARQMNSSGGGGIGIAVGTSGDIYYTGSFGGTPDFDPGAGVSPLTSCGSQDAFVSKLDAAGNFGWVKQICSSGTETGSCIATDISDNVYASGKLGNNISYDPYGIDYKLSSAGATDIFIFKIGSSSVAVTENLSAEDVQVYPNPAKGQVNISISHTQPVIELEIRDMLGRTLARETAIDVATLTTTIPGPAGIYLLQLHTGTQSICFKVIKE